MSGHHPDTPGQHALSCHGRGFVTGTTPAGKRTLTVRDAQHEYVFEAE